MYLKIKGKRYKFNPNINTLKVLGVLILIIVLICVVRSCTKYNRSIRGAEYQEVPVLLPEYQIRPCVAPDGTPTCDYFSIYPSEEGDKVVYLTFDDGPSSNVTPKVLDVLKKNNIKATFFVLGSQAEKNPDILTRTASEGHTIGNHSYSQDIAHLYGSTDAFTEEITRTRDIITNIVGEDKYSNIFRFPGGAFRNERTEFKEILLQHDIAYINWNCLTGDSETRNPVSANLYNQAVKSAKNASSDSLVLLIHDAGSKQATVDALPSIIKYFKDEGYRFDTLKRK